jgi:pimeloyl-ACP methyl ester carboxylesterase
MTVGVTADPAPVRNYLDAERRLLDRYGTVAERRTVEVPSIEGRASVLVAGDGPPVMMVVGAGPPTGIWVPLMAELTGFRLHAVDLPGLGLTSPVRGTPRSLRSTAVAFLDDVAGALALDTPAWVAQSMGALWTFWLALDRPDRVRAIAALGCPATLLHTSAPLPLRLASIRSVGALVQRLDPPSPRQVDRFIRMAGETFEGQDELRALFLALERLPGYGRALVDVVHAAVRLRGARPEIALTAEQMRAVRRPVQLVWGDRDPFGPPDVGRRAADLLPDAELHVVAGGHGFWVDRPAPVAGVVAPFLARHRGAG